jgi:hypothetical protein
VYADAGAATPTVAAIAAAAAPPIRAALLIFLMPRAVWRRTPPEVMTGDGSLVNRDDGLIGVVFLVCLARVVFAFGVDRARDVFAIPAFADDDEYVVHLTPAVVEP